MPYRRTGLSIKGSTLHPSHYFIGALRFQVVFFYSGVGAAGGSFKTLATLLVTTWLGKVTDCYMNPNMKTVVCLALLVFWFPRSSSGFEKVSACVRTFSHLICGEIYISISWMNECTTYRSYVYWRVSW